MPLLGAEVLGELLVTGLFERDGEDQPPTVRLRLLFLQ